MPHIKSPVFIIGCPRSGTTLLYSILHGSEEFYSSSMESHYLWKKWLPDKRDPLFAVHLTEADFQPGDTEYLERKYHEYTYAQPWQGAFARFLFRNRTFGFLMKSFQPLWRKLNAAFKQHDYRVIDKTPPNTYRISFLKKAFPDAKFIYIKRDPRTNISSLMEAWRSTGKRFDFKFRKFYDYNKKLNIKGYSGSVWKFTNPPGWEEYMDKPLEEVCAFQWLSAHKYAQKAFASMQKGIDYEEINYEDLITEPEKYIEALCDFIDIPYEDWVQSKAESLPVVSTDTVPDKNKWLKNKPFIDRIMPKIEEVYH